MEENNKKIDEVWKEAVKKEGGPGSEGPDTASLPEAVDFSFFVTTLAIQASISLGQIPNPVTNKKEENVNQAKVIIDTLDIIKEKTKGNLTPEENSLLENILYELKMLYVEKSSKK
jgi:hypothetical protein